MNPGQRSKTPAEMLAWLTENVRIDEDGCRIWAGAVQQGSGVPVINWHYKRENARRLLATLLGRAPTASQVVYQSCGKGQCMNPEHLRVGSRKQAFQVKARNGAFCSGARRSVVTAIARAPTAKLGIRDRETVLRLREQGETWSAIGQRYGVTGWSVSKCVRSWRKAGLIRWAA